MEWEHFFLLLSSLCGLLSDRYLNRARQTGGKRFSFSLYVREIGWLPFIPRLVIDARDKTCFLSRPRVNFPLIFFPSHSPLRIFRNQGGDTFHVLSFLSSLSCHHTIIFRASEERAIKSTESLFFLAPIEIFMDSWFDLLYLWSSFRWRAKNDNIEDFNDLSFSLTQETKWWLEYSAIIFVDARRQKERER